MRNTEIYLEPGRKTNFESSSNEVLEFVTVAPSATGYSWSVSIISGDCHIFNQYIEPASARIGQAGRFHVEVQVSDLREPCRLRFELTAPWDSVSAQSSEVTIQKVASLE